MKKILTLAVLVAFMGSLITSPALGAVKAGATCTKAGLTSTVSGKKFTCTKSGKKLVWDKGIVIQKPTTSTEKSTQEVTPNPEAPTTPAASVESIPAQTSSGTVDLASPLSLKECRIADQRLKIVQTGQSIAYPIKPYDPAFTSKSEITIALVPLDFGDTPGTYSPQKIIDSIIKESDDFARWYSRGNLKFKWVTQNSWIRASSHASDFNWIHPNSSVGNVDDVQMKVGKALLALADKSMDLSGVQDVYFIYPKEILDIKDSINFASSFETSKGRLFLGLYADSKWMFESKTDPAMWLMHEHMHKFGFAGHAPAYPGLFSISNNQSGPSKVFDLWDRMALDWLNPEDIFCIDFSSLNGQEVTLVPEESEQAGTQGVAIKINSHKLLILESHRKDKWSTEYPSGVSGLTAMVVDTQFDTDRSGEWSVDDGKGITNIRTANYLQFTKYNHGMSPEIQYVGSFPLNYLLYPGESFDYEGIHVELLTNGTKDLVKMSRS